MRILDIFKPRQPDEAPVTEAELARAIEQAQKAVRQADQALGSAIVANDLGARDAARQACRDARQERADAELALEAFRAEQTRQQAVNRAAAAVAQWDKAEALTVERDKLGAKVQQHIAHLARDFRLLAEATEELAHAIPKAVRSECGELLDAPALAFAASRHLFKIGLSLPAPKANESDRVTIPELGGFVAEGSRAVLRRRP